MLSEIGAADVHQLNGVQGTSAEMWFRARVCRHAVEDEIRTHDRHTGAGADLIDRRRVPCIREIHVVEVSRAGDELLGTGALLRGTAEEDHGAVLFLPDEVFLDRHRRRVAARPEQIVSAAVSRAALDDRFAFRRRRALAESGERVVFREKADRRLPASHAIRRRKRGGDPGDPLFNGKAFLFQRVDQRGGGFLLLIGKLRVSPDRVRQPHRLRRLFPDQGFGQFYIVHKGIFLSLCLPPPRGEWNFTWLTAPC